MARHDAGWWAARVAELERSGDAEQIARRYRVTATLLRWWRWKLRARGAKVAMGAGRRLPKQNDEQRLLPIVVAPAEAPAQEPEPTTIIETTRGRISIRGQLSADQLAAVVAELVRGC